MAAFRSKFTIPLTADTLIVDTEVYPNFFLVVMRRLSDGKTIIFERSSRKDFDGARLRRILEGHRFVTYNGKTFDLPIMMMACDGASTDALHRAANQIIQGGLRYWQVEKALNIRIPFEIQDNHVDLIEPQPNPFAGLKELNGRMHGPTLQDLPYEPGRVLSDEEMDRTIAYCGNDIDATQRLWETLAEPMELRDDVSRRIGQDVRSMSDTQMGLAIIKKRVEERLGKRIPRVEPEVGGTFRYKAPEYIRFKTPVLQEMLARIEAHDFFVQYTGKVEMPDFLGEPVDLGSMHTFAMGIGGLHSTESNRAVKSDDKHALVDFDVASYYPAIIIGSGLYPSATGPAFLDVYRAIRDERVEAKKAAKVAKEAGDMARFGHFSAIEKGLKISLNGCFGSLGSPHKFVFAPHLLISVTLTGQLALLMLIERAEAMGIGVVSANTDGVVMRVPRGLWDGLNGDRPKASPLADLIEGWERDTGFVMEGTEYAALYSASVNSYFAIKASGGHKRKGPLGNPWSLDKNDFDPVRGQLMKNPQMTICSDAALAMIKHRTPISETIRSCRDIRQFVTVIKATGGATWRDEYLGKVVRYYWSTDGAPIIKAKAHPKTGNRPMVPKTEGARECMRLPDEFPDDIDYARYEAEAETILKDLGFYGPKRPLVKPVRLTKENRGRVLMAYSVAA